MTTIISSPQSAAEVLPCLISISQVTASLSHFQNHFLQAFSKCQNFLSVLQEDHKSQLQITVNLCQRMNALMNERLSLPNQQRNQAKTVITEQIQRSCSLANKPKSKKNLSLEKPNKKDKNYKSQKIKKSLVSEKCINFIQKSNDIQEIQVYTCVLCLKGRTSPFLWGEAEPYLNHIRQQHKLQPDFQILLCGSQNISFSHVLFHGTLTNVFKNETTTCYKYYLIVLYLLQQGRFDELYVCGCLQINHQKSFKNGSPIFLRGGDYQFHVSRNHKNIQQPGSTHCLVFKDKNARAIRLDSSDDIFTGQKMVDIIESIRVRLEKYYSVKYFSLLKSTSHSKYLILELISTLQLKKQTETYFYPLPYCPICKQYFSTIASHQTHKTKFHQNKENCEIKKYGLVQMKDYLSHEGLSFDQQNMFTSTLSKEENRLLNLQLYLIHGKVRGCGQCSLLFFDSSNLNYLLHLYRDHGGNCSKVSHRFMFLKDSYNVENEENLNQK